MTFWTALKATYGGSLAFLIACPRLASIPVVFELLQHAVEVHIGMYDSIAAAKAVEHHPLRMAFGMLKIVALTVPLYWGTRFLPHRDAGFAGRVDRLAVRLFAGAYRTAGLILVSPLRQRPRPDGQVVVMNVTRSWRRFPIGP